MIFCRLLSSGIFLPRSYSERALLVMSAALASQSWLQPREMRRMEIERFKSCPVPLISLPPGPHRRSGADQRYNRRRNQGLALRRSFASSVGPPPPVAALGSSSGGNWRVAMYSRSAPARAAVQEIQLGEQKVVVESWVVLMEGTEDRKCFGGTAQVAEDRSVGCNGHCREIRAEALVNERDRLSQVVHGAFHLVAGQLESCL